MKQENVPQVTRSWHTRMQSVIRQLHKLADEVHEDKNNDPIRITGLTNIGPEYKLIVTDGSNPYKARCIPVDMVQVTGEDYG